jgi:hypothetical protein
MTIDSISILSTPAKDRYHLVKKKGKGICLTVFFKHVRYFKR